MSTGQGLSPAANALDSLRRVAADLPATDPAAPASLKGVLAWGWHAVALLAYARLLPARDDVDVWLWDYLEKGEPALDVARDALWEERRRLSLLELLDILSEESLPILKPEFYQGWQDRTTRCRTLRSQVAKIVGHSIATSQRDDLLLLLAAYHRLLRLPAGVDLEGEPVLRAVPALLDLLESLIEDGTAEAGELRDALARCRTALKL